MKKYLIAILMAMPVLASAQDNTWERIEQEPVSTVNPDAKYLAENEETSYIKISHLFRLTTRFSTENR